MNMKVQILNYQIFCWSHVLYAALMPLFPQVYMLMERCWDVDPSRRPTFQSLFESIEAIRRTYEFQPNVRLAQISQ